MELNFILIEMTYLRYFIPLIKEGHKRGLKSIMYVVPCSRYNGTTKFFSQILVLSKKYNFEVRDINKFDGEPGLTFVVEGQGREWSNGYNMDKKKTISLSYMTDFTHLEKTYVNDVDYIIHTNENLIKWAKSKNLLIYVYTINTETELEWQKKLGVNGVFTDNPTIMNYKFK